MFDPKTNKFPYPEDTGEHYLKVTKDNGVVLDDKYPYVNKSFGFRVLRFLTEIVINLIVFPMTKIRLGLKVEGKKNLKKHKKVIKNGIITVANHIHMWDFLGIMRLARPKWPDILVWEQNVRGKDAKSVRIVGGIPIPSSNIRGFAKMSKETIEFIQNGGWLHIDAEGSMWEFYAPIRPFKDGAAYFAYKSDRPILPLAYSYRPVKGIRKKLFHQIATLTLHVGEPLYIDKSLPKNEAIKKLTIQAHEAVCELAGFKKGENIYSPLYNKKSSKRIDYYTHEYGIGYKGSH